MNSDAHFENERKCGRKRESPEEGATAREINARQQGEERDEENGQERERERGGRGRKGEERKKTPAKYVVTKGMRNSSASGNKSKKGRKQLRNSHGRYDRMIGGQGGGGDMAKK